MANKRARGLARLFFGMAPDVKVGEGEGGEGEPIPLPFRSKSGRLSERVIKQGLAILSQTR